MCLIIIKPLADMSNITGNKGVVKPGWRVVYYISCRQETVQQPRNAHKNAYYTLTLANGHDNINLALRNGNAKDLDKTEQQGPKCEGMILKSYPGNFGKKPSVKLGR